MLLAPKSASEVYLYSRRNVYKSTVIYFLLCEHTQGTRIRFLIMKLVLSCKKLLVSSTTTKTWNHIFNLQRRGHTP